MRCVAEDRRGHADRAQVESVEHRQRNAVADAPMHHLRLHGDDIDRLRGGHGAGLQCLADSMVVKTVVAPSGNAWLRVKMKQRVVYYTRFKNGQ